MSLTPSQTLAVRTIDRPLAVVAGAGSGKTLVLAERYRWLIEEAKVPVHRILAFTFTEKAAREIRERILNRKIIRPEDEGFLQIGTVHSFLSGLLRRYGSLLGLDPAFTILDEASARAERDVRIKSHLIGRLREKNPAVVEANERFGFWRLNQICQKLFQRTDLMVDPESFPSGDDEDIRLFKDAADLFHQWLDDKIKSASLTFDDLEILSFRLLKEHPEAADKIRRRFFHILVDEFQDTSPLQARIIEALVGPGMNTLGVKTLGVKTLFVVGDPGQSIYRFRRVETSIFKNRAEQIKKEGGQIVQLDESFRVPPRLAKIVNKVFIPLFNEEGVSTLYRPLVSVHHQTTGALKIVVAPEERLSIDRLRRLEAKWIAQNLKERNLSPKDRDSTALLFRASQPMLIYREELEKAGIPVQVTRTHNLLVEPEIRDLLHLLSYLAGDRNPIVRTALLRSSFFNLSEAFIERYSRGGSTDFTEPYTPDFFTAADDRHRWEHLRQLTARWEKLSRAIPPSRLFRIVVDDLGLTTGRDSIQRLYVEQWLKLVDDIERNGGADLVHIEETFTALRSVERGIEAFDPKNAPGCVKLMTIHSAKGLEFNRVFLPQLYGGGRSDSADFLLDAEKGTGTVSLAFRKKSPEPVRGLKMELSESPLFRELKEVEKRENREEEKRLLYVAMTRSREELTLFLKDPKKKIRLAEADRMNDWLWTLLEEERREAVHLLPKLEFEDSRTRWGGLTSKLEEAFELHPHPHPLPSRERESLGIPSPLGGEGQGEGKIPHKPTHTVSEIETFMRCEKEYELRYIYGIAPISAGGVTPSVWLPIAPQAEMWRSMDISTTFQTEQATATPRTSGKPIGGRTPPALMPRQWGLLVHEILQFLDFKTFANAETVIDQALINQQLSDPDGAVRRRIEETLSALKANEKIIAPLALADTVYTELLFFMDGGDFFLKGALDRLIHHGDDWIVLDYKTDRLDGSSDELNRRIAAYRGQMACYALAASEIVQADRIKSVLLFTDGPVWSEKEWNGENLTAAKKELQKIHLSIQEKKPGAFNYPEDLAVCRHCAYYEGNYCGVQTLFKPG